MTDPVNPGGHDKTYPSRSDDRNTTFTFRVCWSSQVRYLPYLILVEIVYYEEIKREVKRIHIIGFRCNERLKAKTEGSTRLAYTVLPGHLNCFLKKNVGFVF